MARYERIARITVIVAVIVAAVVLGVLLDHHLGGQWSPEHLWGFIS
jgi:hypothetical protein